jgi:predicted phage baseplate assembly protein
LVHSSADDRHYMTYVDEDRRTRLVFGDGRRGARLPTGAENVVATYRYGAGREGQVAANSLTLLQRQPLGITAVTNPAPALGGADAESMDTARIKAPAAVRPLGRIVSLRDYEDFIYGLPGVGRVQVKPLWNGQTRLAHVTVAAAGGEPINRDSLQYQAIVRAVQANRASPHHHVEIDPADILHFNLAATIYVGPNYSLEAVANLAEESLVWTYSFENREFGRGVAASDVTGLIQSVPGVQHVELTAFHTLGSTPTAGLAVQPYLSAHSATWSRVNNAALPAQLMLVNTAGGINLTVETAS